MEIWKSSLPWLGVLGGLPETAWGCGSTRSPWRTASSTWWRPQPFGEYLHFLQGQDRFRKRHSRPASSLFAAGALPSRKAPIDVALAGLIGRHRCRSSLAVARCLHGPAACWPLPELQYLHFFVAHPALSKLTVGQHRGDSMSCLRVPLPLAFFTT